VQRRQVISLSVGTLFVGGRFAFGEDATEVQKNYFPQEVFDDRSRLDDRVSNWYSKHLIALDEASLYPATPNVEVYRFTWLRTFHNPMVFRVAVHVSGSGALTVKRTNGAGGYEPGVIDLRKEIALSNEQINQLKEALVKMSYWELPTRLKTEGLDGAQWIVEANANGRYKIVDRWTGSDLEIQSWGMQLIKLSGVEVGEVY
jgi:hypothetical protein